MAVYQSYNITQLWFTWIVYSIYYIYIYNIDPFSVRQSIDGWQFGVITQLRTAPWTDFHELWGEVDAVWLSETGVVPMESADEAGGAQLKTHGHEVTRNDEGITWDN